MVAVTSEWFSVLVPHPAAGLDMQESPATRRPAALDRIASGTVDIPIASAPQDLNVCISVGVS